MRVVFLSEWFAEKMGYAENCLPKAMAALGHEVHVIAGNVQPYFNTPTYKDTYEPFLGPPTVAVERKQHQGYELHRLPHAIFLGRVRLEGLGARLREIKPDVVQTFEVASLPTYEAGFWKPFIGYRLFTESHLHASVFAPKGRAGFAWSVRAAKFLGSLLNPLTERCYAISSDVASIAIDRLGVRRGLVEVCSLGVDTELFHPPESAAEQSARTLLREKLGFAPRDIVAIYTGRLAFDKGPQLLARAIDKLRRAGEPFSALFVGSGTAEERAAISECRGCVIHEFVQSHELPPFYRAADIGVWPHQESTSQLDAAASGLPIIVSDAVHVRERADGNGLFYRDGDVDDLAARIIELRTPERRAELGAVGRKKMVDDFSWMRIAAQRVIDYERALRPRLKA